ncbi:MAG: NAD(P)-dependent oxidoreductase [Deltaproteobacteria bacterium]|nr:NAD(P)-dependent oxidoreductase [Deltaproteobacteria bacterium]
MKTLVSGASGFIGGFLAEQLVASGHQVSCLVRKSSSLQYLNSLLVETRPGSLEDPDSLCAAVRDVEVVYHLAGVTAESRSGDFARVNSQGTANLVNACLTAGKKLKKFVYVSSIAAAGPAMDRTPLREEHPPRPLSLYGKSKLAGEEAAAAASHAFSVTIVRPPAVYGPRDRDILTFFKLIHSGIKPILLGGERYFNLIFVKDLVEGIALSASKMEEGCEIYYLSEERPYSWTEVMQTIESALGKRALPLPIPLFLLKTISHATHFISRWTGKSFPLTPDKVAEIEQRYWICDISKARNQLGFTAKTALEGGFFLTAEWYREQGWLSS